MLLLGVRTWEATLLPRVTDFTSGIVPAVECVALGGVDMSDGVPRRQKLKARIAFLRSVFGMESDARDGERRTGLAGPIC